MTDPRPSGQTKREGEPIDLAAELATLFREHYGYVWQTLLRLGVPARDVEDVAHQTFLVVHQKLAGCDRSRPMRPWLFGIAYRVALAHRRLAHHRREVLSFPSEPATDEPSPSDRLEATEARSLFLRAMETLVPEQRAVLVMHDIDGHTMPEIATTLEVPLNTAYSRLRLARRQLAHAVRSLRAGGAQ